MSLQALYSFDHIQTSDLSSLPKVVSVDSPTTVSTSGGRDGTGALFLNSNNNSGVIVALNNPHSLVTIGTWVLVEHLGFGTNTPFLTLGHPNAGSTVHTSLVAQPDGSIAVCRGVGTIVGQSVGGVFTMGMPLYLEWQSQIGANGFAIIKINETEVLHLNNINNINGSDNNVKMMMFGSQGIGRFRYDDVYIVTGEDNGDGWTGFKGITKITSRLVNAIGDLNQWTPSNPTGINWQNVDENIPSVNDYNDAVTPGLTDLYGLEDVSFNPAAIQVDMYLRKLDAGPCSVAHVLKSGGVVYESAELAALGSSYKYFHKVYTRLPNGTAWDITNYNALQAGPKKVL